MHYNKNAGKPWIRQSFFRQCFKITISPKIFTAKVLFYTVVPGFYAYCYGDIQSDSHYMGKWKHQTRQDADTDTNSDPDTKIFFYTQ